MASADADLFTPPAEHGGWERLERAVHRAAAAGDGWRRRALDAEEELERLRGALEALTGPVAEGGPGAADGDGPGGAAEIRRLRAENAVLASRAAEARKRIGALLSRLAVLEGGR